MCQFFSNTTILIIVLFWWYFFNWCVIRNSKTNHRFCPAFALDFLKIKNKGKNLLVFDPVLLQLTVSTVGIIIFESTLIS